MQNESNLKLVIFSDIHYAPEKPINNGSIIDKKLMEYAVPLINKLTVKEHHLKI